MRWNSCLPERARTSPLNQARDDESGSRAERDEGPNVGTRDAERRFDLLPQAIEVGEERTIGPETVSEIDDSDEWSRRRYRSRGGDRGRGGRIPLGGYDRVVERPRNLNSLPEEKNQASSQD